MAILKIARMGHPLLRVPAQEIANPLDPRVNQLIDDMLETMVDADGTGLAAPQVHVPLRVVLFQVAAERGVESDLEVPLTALTNPVIEHLTSNKEYDWESCLSVPGLTGLVPRCSRIRYSGIMPDGKKIDRVAEGFHARVVQHECDHLDGYLYPQRMDDMSLLMFSDELRSGIPDRARKLMEVGDAER